MKSRPAHTAAMAWILFLVPALLLAQKPERSSLDLTIYQQFGWVHDSRMVELEPGENEFTLYGVARQIDTESVLLELDGRVPELRVDLNHQGWDRAYKDLTGRQIRLISETGDLVEGEVIEFSQGRLYMRLQSGKYTIIPNPYQYRMELDHEPEMERDGASLHARIQVEDGGTHPVDLYYVANNLSWSVDYAIMLDETQMAAQMTGRASIRNQAGLDFDDASVRLVAGQVSVTPRQPHHYNVAREMVMMEYDEAPDPQRLSDYYVYNLPGKRNIRENETYQIPLITADDVAFTKEYRHTTRPFSSGFRDPRNVTVTWLFENDEEHGLGQPLPPGSVRVYEVKPTENGRERSLLGQDRITGKAVGDPIRVTTGRSFDIGVTEEVVGREQVAGRVQEESRDIRVRNGTDEEVVVVIEVPLQGQRTVTEESASPVSYTADRRVYNVTVPAEGANSLRITVRQER